MSDSVFDSKGRKKVAVEFADQGSDFWHVYSPPVTIEPVSAPPSAIPTAV
jgi:hypothetical protein